MKKIGKNKSPSYDGMTDIIFQRDKYKFIKLYGHRPNKNATIDEIKKHEIRVRWNLASKLKVYLNFCIKEKTRLLYNQDLLE